MWVDNQQFGFLPKRSTTDAVIQVIEDWSKACDEHNSVHAIFFDISKAFDMVSHRLLLRKLESYLPAYLTSWIAEYLTNRRQRVAINNRHSEWKPVKAGVIQGSVLGPTLFILFIADINKYLPPEIKLLKYADDLLAAQTLCNILESTLQMAADGVQQWSKDNLMQLNIKKTKVMVINSTAMPNNITINGTELEIVNSYKYLGTQLTNTLDWDEQWKLISPKFNSAFYLIKTLKNLGF